MASAGRAYIDMVPNMTKFGTDVQSKSKGIFKKLAVGFTGVFAAVKVKDFLGDSIRAAREDAKAQTELAQSLKSMGRSIPAQELGDLASTLELQTGISDEAIRSGQTLFATFGNISDKLLKDLTPALVDYAAKFTGGNMDSAATQLGKALDNPIKGLSALSRVGVSFTDQQKEQITAMTEAGDIAGAQGLIMEAITPQIAGAGKAGADAADLSRVKWENLKETIGQKLIPVMDRLSSIGLTILGWVQKGGPWVKLLAGAVAALAVAWKLATSSTLIFGHALNTLPIVAIAAGIVLAATLIITNWGKVKKFLIGVWDAIKSAWSGVTAFFAGIWNGVVSVAKGAANFILGFWNKIIGALNVALDILDKAAGPFINFPEIPKIPTLDEGGLVTQTGLAVVHRGETFSGVDRVLPQSPNGMEGMTVRIVDSNLGLVMDGVIETSDRHKSTVRRMRGA
jgi:hypothetical protein